MCSVSEKEETCEATKTQTYVWRVYRESLLWSTELTTEQVNACPCVLWQTVRTPD